MSNEYKKCPNGHYYQGSHCPFCKTNNGTPDNSTSGPTEVFAPGNGQNDTEPMPGAGGGTNTTVVDGFGSRPTRVSPGMPSNQTVFEPEEGTDIGNGGNSNYVGGYRIARKIVGWLVSYTLDELGVDFKLYEGRNIIGRDAECNISVNDNMVSAKHAVILFRAGKYSITDSQSSHGTFVNDRDIELEPCYLQDGDMIRMGKTLFKFRTSF